MSKINSIAKKDLQQLVYNSNSLADVLRKLNLYVSSGNYKPLKIRLDDDNIDYAHIKLGLNSSKNKIKTKIKTSEVLIENSKYSNSCLKQRILKEGILKNQCSKCKLDPIWCDDVLTLQLDHINGNNRDNRIENLRILCPNCHTQTKNYGSKNIKKRRITKHCSCGNNMCATSKMCMNCIHAGKSKNTRNKKILWPNYNELLKMLSETNYTKVAQQLGVSDNAIRKHIKSINEL